jgi:hypothetical protein
LALTSGAGLAAITGAGAITDAAVGSGAVITIAVGFDSTAASTAGVDGGWKLATEVGAGAVSMLVSGVDATIGGSVLAVVVGEGIGRCSAIWGLPPNIWITMPAEI